MEKSEKTEKIESSSNDADVSDNVSESDSNSESESDSEFDSEKESYGYITGSVASDMDEIGETTDNIIKHLETSLKMLDEIGEKKMEKPLEKAVLSEFSSMSYLESSPFGSNKFKVKKEFKEKLESVGVKIEERYRFSEFCEFLTKYVINHGLCNEVGIIKPDKFLCSLLQIEEKECTFIKLMGTSKNVFV
jgi:hypothetical protein